MDPQWQQREQIRYDEMAAVLSTLNILNAQAERPPRILAAWIRLTRWTLINEGARADIRDSGQKR